MPDIKYQRLTGTHTRQAFSVALASRTSLWLGPDHLLCVEYNGFSETYKRFYFRDIQAVTIRETPWRTIWNGILIIPLGLCWAALMTSSDRGTAFAWGLCVAVVGIPFLLNNLWGTACACRLRTAVQVEDLPLRRVRKARRVLQRIRPLIAAAQDGEIPAEMVTTWLREAAATESVAPAPAPAAVPAPPVVEGSPVPPRLAP